MRLEDKTRSEWGRYWRSKISAAEDKHKRKVEDWATKVIKEYSGDFGSDVDTNEAYKQVTQVIYSVEETVQPHLFFQNPRMVAKAAYKKSPWESKEEFVEEMVNAEYRDIHESGYGIELENELALLDARIIGYGVTETKYEVEGEYVEEDKGLMDKAKDFLTGSEKKTLTPVITKERGHITEHVSPLDIMLDPDAKHITKQKCIFKKLHLSKNDLRSVKYDQEKVDMLRPTILNDQKIIDMSESGRKDYTEENPDYKAFEGVEIHDLENRVVHTMIKGFDDFIEFGTEYLIPEGSVFSLLWFIEVPGEVYPNAPLKYYRKRALEFSYIYSQVSDQIDKFLPKIGFDYNRLSKPSQAKLKNGTLGAMFETEGPPANVAHVFSPQVQTDLFKYLSMIKEMLNLESSSNDYELSLVDDTGDRKATEARQIQAGTTARRFKPKKRVKGFIRSQAHKIWQVIRSQAPIDHFVRVLGEKDAQMWWADPETGKAQWMDVRDYNFDFDIDSMAPVDRATKLRENQEKLMTVLDPNLRAALNLEKKTLLVSEIFEQFASDNLGVRDISKLLKDQMMLSADEEHSLWMQGQYPPISEDESNNKELLIENFKKHDAYIKSPGFQFLPEEMKIHGMQHRDSYLPFLAKYVQGVQTQPDESQQQQEEPANAGV